MTMQKTAAKRTAAKKTAAKKTAAKNNSRVNISIECTETMPTRHNTAPNETLAEFIESMTQEMRKKEPEFFQFCRIDAVSTL